MDLWRPPTKEQQILIDEEMKSFRVDMKDSIRILREWLEQQPHLPTIEDDFLLEKFLQGCKFSIERCKSKIDLYFSVRGMLPEIFTNRNFNDKDFCKTIESNYFFYLPDLTPDAYRVLCFYKVHPDHVYNVDHVMKFAHMIADLMLYNEKGNKGYITVFHIENITASDLMQWTPPTIKKYVTTVFNAYPLRPKHLFFLKAPSVMQSVFNVAKQFINQKIMDRIRLLSDSENDGWEELYKLVPKSMLPPEFNGHGESAEVLTKKWMKVIEDKKDWFAAQERKIPDESKRPGKFPYNEDLDSGTFRKLAID